MLVLFLIIIGAASVLVSALNSRQLQLNHDRVTADALAQAKAALIAWSVGGGTLRPGDLPCPAADEQGNQAGSCAVGSNSTIGRLPWKTLGIDDLRDSDGVQLWYALSNNFRRTGLTNAAINSDTKGSLLLYAPDGTTLLSGPGEELAAVVFAPGPPLPGQDRASGVNSAANYLESAYSMNNASAAGSFINGPVKNAAGNVVVNDRILAISARELIAAVEKRALKEYQNALTGYAAINGGKYPNPAKYDDPKCVEAIDGSSGHKYNSHSSYPCISDSSVCFGRLPESTLEPYAPLWLTQNAWGRVMTYAVNKNNVLDGSAAECSTNLNMNGTTKAYVLIAPGSARSGQTRPSTILTNYLEDAANADAWTSMNSGQPYFLSPSATSNDQARNAP